MLAETGKTFNEFQAFYQAVRSVHIISNLAYDQIQDPSTPQNAVQHKFSESERTRKQAKPILRVIGRRSKLCMLILGGSSKPDVNAAEILVRQC